MPDQIGLKTELNKRLNALRQLQQIWVPGWKELSTYIDPTRGIFNNDRSRIGKVIDHKILLDSHATFAKNITTSGMQTGMTDPARPWFKLSLDEWYLNNIKGAREWLDECTNRMWFVMSKSNIYKVFHSCYDELVQFGTGCYMVLGDYQDIIRGRSFTAGEYYLGTDCKGRVNAFGRDFQMTAGQMKEQFGQENLSQEVLSQLQNNRPDQIFNICHLIEANDTRIPGMEDFRNMPFRSAYWEKGNGENKFLALRGFRRFPVIAPRWNSVTTDFVYAYGLGHSCLGDVKQLQQLVRDKMLAEQKAYDPPVQQDASVTGHANTLPGGVTKQSGTVPNTGVRATYEVDPRIAEMDAAIDNMHRKIDRHMLSDIFLMITNIQDTNRTAFEIAKREQEKMMMLGPILHTTNEEMHDETIELIFDLMLEAGAIPEPPPELEGIELKVQYVSILAQAQRALGVQSIDRTIARIGNVAAAGRPEAWDVLDLDAALIESSDLEGTPAKLINDKEEIDAIRQARLEQQNRQIAMEAGVQVADAAAKLGKTPAGGDSVLNRVGQAMQAVQGR